jgi:hypothetical protein
LHRWFFSLLKLEKIVGGWQLADLINGNMQTMKQLIVSSNTNTANCQLPTAN